MELKVPEIGESIFEALLVKWHQNDGASISKDDLLCELETDKITLELHAETNGVLSVSVPEGTMVKVGEVIAVLKESEESVIPEAQPVSEAPAAESVAQQSTAAPVTVAPKEVLAAEPAVGETTATKPLPPIAPPVPEQAPSSDQDDRITRQPLTPIRRRIAERLVAARQQTAMLTTFNEVDLSRMQALRAKHQETFRQRHGVKLGLMSFFVKAVVEALREYPLVNARLEEDAIVQQHFYDIGIAISAEKGLVVPVLRDADRLHFAEIEQAIIDYAEKIQSNRLGVADLKGGTFTITNGGVFGSLLSTPLLNPPQCAVLGMHTIQQRPVVRDDEIVIRPMMYLALSYDHRLLDGREAVGFLKRVCAYVEEPEEMLLEF
ncbi:dihydrolipoamide succinyltransferase [Syntrophotalea acetylenivorans]|uniref:Dihydrolipoyllysine-residue succinyltransferase n=1 Tax=Syntrophotalea acetylenivorans TaxID=1842532 RepID=A0A1L3GRL8_9BACT|nr:2-oxoglutarate dehydrogenase complex dihydrolipoyllysine-residue succinyltransferase [Syntrophotalea acetylenivorans]APG28555.1 dihydrolipoamide succinyltransferase [Syntrophotalea acetylenivorans]